MAAQPSKPVKRRTQQERREATIDKLLTAATETLIEVGYAEASVQRICERAGLSQGALFRHFATREALMVAVGEDVGEKLLARYERKFKTLARREDDARAEPPQAGRDEIQTALALVREACRSRLNQAWYELAIAARTNPGLRAALEPTAERYFESITRLAAELLPSLAETLGESFGVLVTTVIAIFDGEVLQRFVVRDAKADAARMALLGAAVSSIAVRR